MKAMITLTNFTEVNTILAGSRYYYQIINNIDAALRHIKTPENLHQLMEINSYVMEHGRAVSEFALLLGAKLSLSEKQLYIIDMAAKYHDIAQLFFPPSFFDHANSWDLSQWQAIYAHPLIAAEIIQALFDDCAVAKTIAYHHELWGGTGYPFRLTNRNIPIEALVVGISDLFISMTECNNPYREPAYLDDVLLLLDKGIGKLYDERLILAFRHTVRELIKEDSIHFFVFDSKLSSWRKKNSKNNKSLALTYTSIDKLRTRKNEIQPAEIFATRQIPSSEKEYYVVRII